METRLNGRSFGRGKTWAETVGGASGVGDALPGGELEPEDCVGEIGGGALPVFVALRKIELRLGSALLGGADLASLAGPLSRLALFAAGLLPLSLAAFAWAVRRAKDDGSLTHF